MKNLPVLDRVLLIVLDGVGCGALPDAASYGDVGSNSLGNVDRAEPSLRLPNLERLGLGHVTPMRQVQPVSTPVASYGKCSEASVGKDTTSGHWEMAGVPVKNAFATFPNGFSDSVIHEWVQRCKLPGVLGNVAASGTEIIQRLGEEHLRTLRPILYTSADSVWQVAAHEDAFGLERLYSVCREARTICDRLQISRVIARPFLGSEAANFRRTYNRKDYSVSPPATTMMETLLQKEIPVTGIGKIWNIFNGVGIQASIETHGNTDTMLRLKDQMEHQKKGLLFVNLIDFDMNYGHRRDVSGYARALEEFDAFLPVLESQLNRNDLVIVTSDHGNDPTFTGTDHTREYVPLLAWNIGRAGSNLGTRATFADIGQTVLHALTGEDGLQPTGESFLEKVI